MEVDKRRNSVLIRGNVSTLAFKGTASRDFRLLVFSWINFPQACKYSIPLQPFRIFSKIRGDIRGSRCTTGVNDTGGKWKKSSSRKILIILFGHLWVVELTYIYIFAFKFTLLYLQPDIVLIICHRCQQHKGNWWQNLPPVSLIPVVHLGLRISPRIFEKIQNGPNVILGVWGETDSWKKQEAKNLVTLSL